MKININIDFKVGQVVRSLIFVDLFLIGGWGLLEPVFGIFIVKNIPGATLLTVGTSGAIYWLLKSALQLPIAKYLDKTDGERDDFYALVLGLILAAFTAFSFIAVRSVAQLFLAQIMHAVAFGLYAASWPAIFSRHLDKNKVSFDWAMDSTGVGIAAGTSAFIGGALASWLGFQSVFLAAAVLSLCSALVLLLVPDVILPRPNKAAQVIVQDNTPTVGQ